MPILLPYLFVAVLLGGMVFSGDEETTPETTGTKRALVVAIGNYPEPDVNGYRPINALNDVPLIRATLVNQGFAPADILVLRDKEARREALLQALHTLTLEARPNDIVVFHFSGHGDQITDDDGDELDRYDEALVPYGAPGPAFFDDPRQWAAYPGDQHIRDDELNEYLQRLRRKVGPGGNVVVWLDACFSGTGTRNAQGPQPRSLPESMEASPEQGGGLVEGEAATRGAADQASLVVISASRQGELNYETTDAKGRTVGSLSLALSRAMVRLRPGDTYGALFDQVSVLMAALAPNQSPQFEGAADTEVFSGSVVPQTKHFRVAEVRDGALAVVEGGTLVGLVDGSRVAFYPIGTADPATTTRGPLAGGVVESASEVTAHVRLNASVGGVDLRESWAFVTEQRFGDLRVGVRLASGLDAATSASVARTLAPMSVVDVVDAGGDLVVEATRQGRVALKTAADRVAVGEPFSVGVGLAEAVRERVLDFARNRYLAQAEMRDAEIDVRVALVPATHRFERGRCAGSDTTRYGAVRRAGYWELHEDDGYLLRLHNAGVRPAYVAILDLMPDGAIQQLFPLSGQSRDEAYLEPGQVHLINTLCYVAAPPFGNEVLKLFATPTPVDFASVLTTRGAARGDLQSLGPLQRLLAEIHDGTRSAVGSVPTGTGSTHALKIKVVPGVND